MGAERRKHHRIPSDITIQVALDDGGHRARLRDVSESGLCFFLDRAIDEMTILEVAFDLPSEEGIHKVETTGVVVRSRKISPAVDHYEVALFFNGLDDSARTALRAFVGSTRA
jgi:hypothetical protein